MNEKSDEAGDAGAEQPSERPEKTRPATSENDDESPVDEEPAPSRPQPTPRSRPGLFAVAAGLAFLLALAALAGVGYLAWQSRGIGGEQADTDATVASLADNLDESLQSLDNLRERLAALAESDAAYGNELDSLERQLDNLLERYENVPPRLASLETAMASLQGISTGVRDNWLLAEAEYYMQIANAQLQLAGNPHLARLALEFADERVRELGNPALTDVRRALARELRALEAMEKPDIEGVTIQLASLAETVGSLPIQENVARTGENDENIDPGAGAFDRALASLKRAFGDVVSVRRTDEKVRPLLSPDARYFLRANLALQMQTARLALLRGEQAVFEQCLADAADWIREYYDTDAAAIRSALAAIADIRERYVAIDPPDISGSLQLLREYRTLTAAERSVDNAADGDDADSNAQ